MKLEVIGFPYCVRIANLCSNDERIIGKYQLRYSVPMKGKDGIVATRINTQVAIIGGGPAGLLLSHLLRRSGIESVVLESRDRDYTIQRVRAGVLEQQAVDLLTEVGLGDRLHREGQRHDGIYLQYDGHRRHVSLQIG